MWDTVSLLFDVPLTRPQNVALTFRSTMQSGVLIGGYAAAFKGRPCLVQLNELAQFSDSPRPSVTRLVYSKQDIAARKYVVRPFISGVLSQSRSLTHEMSCFWAGTS